MSFARNSGRRSNGRVSASVVGTGELAEPLLVAINDVPSPALSQPPSRKSSNTSPAPPYLPSLSLLTSPPTTPPPSAPNTPRSSSPSTGRTEARGAAWRQLLAMMKKNLTLKRRYWVSLAFELLSPLIVLSILVLGWVLSKEGSEFVAAQVYANDTSIVQSIVSTVNIYPSGSSRAVNGTECFSTKSLPPSAALCFDGDNVALLNAVLGYNGPTSIPTIDEYLGLHWAFEEAVKNSSSPESSIEALDSLTDHQLTNIIFLGQLSFAPNTSAVRALITLLNSTHPLFHTLDVAIYNSEDEAVSAALDHAHMWALLVFNELDVAGGHVDYTIRMNYTALPSTSTTISKFALGLDDSFKRYYYSGFLTLQTSIDAAVLLLSAKNETLGAVQPLREPSNRSSLISRTNVTSIAMPTASYEGSPFYTTIGPVISLVLAMCTLFPVSRLIKNIVEEKESRTKETMKMMGMRDSVYFASWLLTALIQFTLTIIPLTLLLHWTLVPNTDASLLFVLFFCFVLTQITFSFLVSVFFNSAKVAGIVGPLVLFACVMPRYAFFNTDPNEALFGKSMVSFLAPTAFTLGADLIVNYEGALQGLQWSNVDDDAFSMMRVLLFLFFDAALYGWLAWYLGHILPNEYGQRLPPWFCLMPSFYFSSLHEKQRAKKADMLTINDSNDETQQSRIIDVTGDADNEPFSSHIEPVNSSLADRAVVQISGLRKVFIEGRGSARHETVAVNRLNLTLYEGQITALLGHNGAGKTSTIAMLTGLIPPSEGDCLMYGHSIINDLDIVRQSLGVCPQYDVLFDRLTVKEHLQLYAVIKGVSSDEIDSEVSRFMDEIGLRDKRHAYASALSGGQRRKLSVALALIGGSKVVFLDEPTSGMDPWSRRSTWEILRKNKAGRVIVLTTHFMDEADLLGDRIAIMGEGKLRCAGSPLFLKSRFGIGYNITLTRANKRFRLDEISRLMLKHIYEARLLSSAGGEVSYRLPLAAVSRFPPLFAEIEKKRKKFGIGSYGISMTTIEEVFMRISQTTNGDESENGENDNDGSQSQLQEESKMNGYGSGPSSGTATPIRHHRKSSASFLVGELASDTLTEAEAAAQLQGSTRSGVPRLLQFRELLRKRWMCALRDLTGKFYEVILPVLVVALVLLILKVNVNPAGPEILLDSSLYTSVDRDDALSFHDDSKDVSASAHILYTPAFPELENDTLYFLSHRPAIIMEHSNYNTSLSMSTDELLPTIKSHTGQRYGAILLNDTVYTRFNWTSGGIAKDNIAIPTPLSILHNASYIHALPVVVAELQQARWTSNRLQLGLTDGNVSAVYNVRNHPLPLTSRENIRLQTYLTLFAALFVLIPFTYLPASFVLFVVKERSCKSKHLQLSSGVDKTMYWMATYVWDSLNYFFVVVSVMIVFLGYGNAAFVGSVRAAAATFLLMLLYGLSCTPLSYCYSFLFDNYTSAQVGIVGLHCLTGFGLVVMNFILDNLGNYRQVNASLKPFYRLFPPFALGEGLIALSTRDFTFLNAGTRPDAFAWEITGRNLVYLMCETFAYMTLTLAIEHDLFGLVTRYWQSLRFTDDAPVHSLEEEDEDVAAERRRIECGAKLGSINEESTFISNPSNDIPRKSPVRPSPSFERPEATSPPRSPNLPPRPIRRSMSNSTSPDRQYRTLVQNFLSVPGEEGEEGSARRKLSTESIDSVNSFSDGIEGQFAGADVIVMNKLCKVWNRGEGGTRTVAVDSLSLSIQRGVTFGFLGINGAGKTSTLKMLTGDELPTSGFATIAGYDCVKEIDLVHREIGYCPQFDPLLEMLTGREQLTLYARLRGIPSQLLDEVVDRLLSRLGLGAIKDRRCGSYSGGNKRKLSLAIALIGDPSVLFLDEPSTGMDPVSRRFMWSVIAAVADARTVILTSHSMEEVEALCHRVGVMVAGRLRCLGSIQHLKSRFGDGYHLDLNTREGYTNKVKRFIARTFPGSTIEEEHAGRLKYGLPPSTGVSLSAAFGSIEVAKREVGIDDYSISQSSLEQIFLSTVRKAEEADHARRMAAQGEDWRSEDSENLSE